LEQLGEWLQGATGSRIGVDESVTAESLEAANELLQALKNDLQVDEFLWAFDDAGTDMTANIYMARNSDNRYFALEMWWSID
jgi:hypothetical protein